MLNRWILILYQDGSCATLPCVLCDTTAPKLFLKEKQLESQAWGYCTFPLSDILKARQSPLIEMLFSKSDNGSLSLTSNHLLSIRLIIPEQIPPPYWSSLPTRCTFIQPHKQIHLSINEIRIYHQQPPWGLGSSMTSPNGEICHLHSSSYALTSHCQGRSLICGNAPVCPWRRTPT